MTLDAPTDSAFLWAPVREQLWAGHSAASALVDVVTGVLALAPRSRLNLLLHDGQHITATTAGHCLWLRHGGGAVTVSSEPLDPDDAGWQPVPDLSLLQATAARYWIRPLSDPPTAQGRS